MLTAQRALQLCNMTLTNMQSLPAMITWTMRMPSWVHLRWLMTRDSAVYDVGMSALLVLDTHTAAVLQLALLH